MSSICLIQDVSNYDDFTGTHIVADQPIGVVAGNEKVKVPRNGKLLNSLNLFIYIYVYILFHIKICLLTV